MKTKAFDTMAAGFLLARKSCGLLLALVACSGTAWGFAPVPEIDPNAAASSLALLAGGVMLMYDRYRHR
jgi:hypothetical protein